MSTDAPTTVDAVEIEIALDCAEYIAREGRHIAAQCIRSVCRRVGAADELLVALKAMYEGCSKRPNVPAHRLALAAIAKAEGQS